MKLIIFALFSGLLAAQEYPKFPFNLGAGFTGPLGDTGGRLDRGFNLDAGVGLNLHQNTGVMLEFSYNSLNANRSMLGPLGFPNGKVRLWSLTVNPIFYLNPKSPVGVYLIGGGGLYHGSQDAAVPVNLIGSPSVYRPGFNGGMGLTFGAKWHAKVYAEARYHRMIIEGQDIEILPLTFGFRW